MCYAMPKQTARESGTAKILLVCYSKGGKRELSPLVTCRKLKQREIKAPILFETLV